MTILITLLTFVDRKIIRVPSFYGVMCAGYAKLLEVGHLEAPKLNGTYNTGQLFLNKLFGYRGIILFPWNARVFDLDILKKKSLSADTEQPPENEGKTHSFYNALIDARDAPYIRAQTEAVTFLGDQNSSSSLYAIPGLDYVAHEDVLPYTATEAEPLRHELLDKFLIYQPKENPSFVAHETLLVWQKKNRPWLELSDVHKETTEDVRVTVIPFYMGCRGAQTYWWRYSVCMENMGKSTVKLRERHWRIFSLSGVLETVRGRGVVGQEPVLSRTQPAFQYCSHVSLHAPSGHMWGTFRMERQDGYTFDLRVPPFALESQRHESTVQE